LKHWISAFRLRTLPLAIACIGMGGILAYANDVFDGKVFSMALLTAFLLQILSNLANDYGDSINGADSDDRKGPSRAVQSGKISATAMRNAMLLFGLLSLISGLYLLYISLQTQQEFLVFLGIGIVSIIAAITYTVGKTPYGYAGFGDISVLLFFGAASVLGTYYLQAHQIDWLTVLPAYSCGVFAVGVLNVNNIRDIHSDQKAGKYSIPVRLGREKAVYYHWLLLGTGCLAAIMYTMQTFCSPWQWLFLLSFPLFLINARAVKVKKDELSLDPYLKQMVLSTLAFVFLFGLGQLLSSC